MDNVMYKNQAYKGILNGVALTILVIVAAFALVPTASAAESRTQCTVFFEVYHNPSFPIRGPGQPIWISYMTDPGCIDKDKMPNWSEGRNGLLYSNRMFLPELYEAGNPPSCDKAKGVSVNVNEEHSVTFTRGCASPSE